MSNFSPESALDAHRHEFFRMLPLAEDVHRMRGDDRQAIGVGKREAQLLCAGFCGRIRICRVVSVPFAIGRAERRRAEHFVGGKIDQLVERINAAGIVQQMGRADHVVVDKRQRVADAAVDVRGGGQMKNVSHPADRGRDLAVDRRFQIVPDELKAFAIVGRGVEQFRPAGSSCPTCRADRGRRRASRCS